MEKNNRRFLPWSTAVIIVLNFAVYWLQVRSPSVSVFFQIQDDFGFNWVEFLRHPLQEFPTLLTFNFLHGSDSHILFNMLYFLLMGPMVEKTMGHGPFALGYLAWGICSALVQSFFDPFSGGIGASGAVSGTMGAFFVLYPLWFPAEFLRRWIQAQTFSFLKSAMLLLSYIPTSALLISYFYAQIRWGLLSLNPIESVGPMPNVAFWAHVGGFVVGALWMMPYIFQIRRAKSA